MLTHTAEKVESVTAAAAPVVLEDVTKRYGRRRMLRLLGRVGATRGQVAAAFGWHVLFVKLIMAGRSGPQAWCSCVPRTLS